MSVLLVIGIVLALLAAINPVGTYALNTWGKAFNLQVESLDIRWFAGSFDLYGVRLGAVEHPLVSEKLSLRWRWDTLQDQHFWLQAHWRGVQVPLQLNADKTQITQIGGWTPIQWQQKLAQSLPEPLWQQLQAPSPTPEQAPSNLWALDASRDWPWRISLSSLHLQDIQLSFAQAYPDLALHKLEISQLRSAYPEIASPVHLDLAWYQADTQLGRVQLEAQIQPLLASLPVQGQVHLQAQALNAWGLPVSAKTQVNLQQAFHLVQKSQSWQVATQGQIGTQALALQIPEDVAVALQDLRWQGKVALDWPLDPQTNAPKINTQGKLQLADLSLQLAQQKHQLDQLTLAGDLQLASFTDPQLNYQGKVQLTGLQAQLEQQKHQLKDFALEGKVQVASLASPILDYQGQFQLSGLNSPYVQVDQLRWQGQSGWKTAHQAWSMQADLGLQNIQVPLSAQAYIQVQDVQLKQIHTTPESSTLAALQIANITGKNTPEPLALESLSLRELDLGAVLQTPKITLAGVQVGAFNLGRADKAFYLAGLEVGQVAIDLAKSQAAIGTVHLLESRQSLSWTQTNQLEPWQSRITLWQQALQPTDPAPPAEKSPAPSAPWEWFVESIAIQQPQYISLRDLNLQRPEYTQISLQKMRIDDLGMPHAQASPWLVEGILDEQTPFKVQGQVTLTPELRWQTGVRLQDLALSSFDAYSRHYAGINLASGQLQLTLDAQQDTQGIRGNTKLQLYHLDANPISDQAAQKINRLLSMPLGLVISVLEDSDGEIALDIPFDFQAGKTKVGLEDALLLVTRKAAQQAALYYLRNSLQPYTGLITLGQLALEGAEYLTQVKLDPLTFPPAQVGLNDRQQDYLTKIVKMLNDRPSLHFSYCADAGSEEVQALENPQTRAPLLAAYPQLAQITQAEELAASLQKIRQRLVREFLLAANIENQRLALCSPASQMPEQSQVRMGIVQ
ncbi:DUF748 domain-containing protein [Allopseudospirillum japonicum]|nr:DUF748 domain-containing protein [Allopseudospirillum japonicum]